MPYRIKLLQDKTNWYYIKGLDNEDRWTCIEDMATSYLYEEDALLDLKRIKTTGNIKGGLQLVQAHMEEYEPDVRVTAVKTMQLILKLAQTDGKNTKREIATIASQFIKREGILCPGLK